MKLDFNKPLVMASLGLILLAGCKPDPAIEKSKVIGAGMKPVGDPPATEPQSPTAAVPRLAENDASPGSAPASPGGDVQGTILYSGAAPAKVLIDTSMDPACGMGMGQGAGKIYSEQYIVNAGKLANVFLYIKAGPPAAMQAGSRPASSAASGPVVLDQKGCQYTPHVIGVAAGGLVEFRNSDPTMHNIHTMPTVVGNETIDVSQGPRGTPQVKQFNKAELMIPVRCNNHPWMNAFVNVSATPYFAVSDKAGHFVLHGLPAGQYTLAAVHEKLGEKTMQITVKPNASASAEFSFAGR